jgi:hypothetical protein
LVETITRPRSLSSQRKEGMSWLSPNMMPAWQAEVWLGSPQSVRDRT